MLHATRNRNKPNSVTVHVGLMSRARLERSDFLDRKPIKERAGWRWAVYFVFAKIPLFHHRRIKVSLTLLISKLTRSTFINMVRFLSPRLWLTTSQTSLDWPPPPPPRTHTPPPGTFSRLYVLVLCLLVYGILYRDLHDYSSQLWIVRCNMPSDSQYPLRRKTWLTSFRHFNKIFNKNYTV